MSAEIDGGGPAFPREDYQTDYAPGQRGMDLRDYQAAHADIAQHRDEDGIILGHAEAVMGEKAPTWSYTNTLAALQWWIDAEARLRYMHADAMLRARKAEGAS